MVADLPLEKRLQVQGLLVDLQSKLDEQGLVTTVPGELLFGWAATRCRLAPTTRSPRWRS